MKILMAVIITAFLWLIPMAGAITISDAPEIQESCNHFVDNNQIKRIDVSVLPPDGIIYNITTSSSNSVLAARLIGVSAFSNLTYYHPEVTHGWIGIFLDGSKPAFFDIYSSDLSPISDKKQPSQSEALKVVNNIINQRGTQDNTSKRPVASTSSDTESYSNSKQKSNSIKTFKSDPVTTSHSGHYPANRKTKVYHEPGCTWAGKIKPENRITFDSPQEAKAAGYRHCEKC
ncbi:MAG: Ada metal-binding domain-containing protein [Euryarchaeota archaeon]|nr:Ada metal-binding domain-containing protein [Euryarchaeota archaeon]